MVFVFVDLSKRVRNLWDSQVRRGLFGNGTVQGRAGKIDYLFSFNAVETKKGTDRWEIRYKQNAS